MKIVADDVAIQICLFAVKFFEDYGIKMGHAELLSLRISSSKSEYTQARPTPHLEMKNLSPFQFCRLQKRLIWIPVSLWRGPTYMFRKDL